MEIVETIGGIVTEGRDCWWSSLLIETADDRRLVETAGDRRLVETAGGSMSRLCSTVV